LGKKSITILAEHNPAHIFFSGRDAKRASAAIDEIKAAVPDAQLTFIKCDLASLASVDEAGKQFNAASSRLDVLLCNAGIMATPAGLTKDGYEIQFGTNHLGHALLIKHLLPVMLRTAESHGDARIVCLTSTGFNNAPSGGIVFKDLRTTQDSGMGSTWTRYGQSKLANLLYGAELAKRYPSISVAVVHPGVITTDLVGGLGMLNKALVYATNIGKMKTVDEGVQNQLWASTVGMKHLKSGSFYMPVGEPGKPSKYSKDGELSEELWNWTQKQLEAHNI
jgi:NAD(P)-dependent dehydrogenase (short-subunit alcohol dehydrogenase family)